MNRTQRWVAITSALVAFAASLVVLAPVAQAAPSASCRASTSTPTNSGPWIFNSTFDWHVTDGWLWTSSGCRGEVWIRSGGWRFDSRQCGSMQIRRQGAGGTSYVVAGSRKRVCGGATVRLLSGIKADRPIRVEAISDRPADRIPTAWPVGTVLR